MAEETPLLRTSSVSKRFRGVVALADASIRLDEGEILGVIGPNGAGKTTLFNVIAGAMRPSSGTVTFRGRDITRLPADRRLRLGLARTFQLMKPFVSLSVYDNIVVGATGSGLSKRRARVRADEIVELLGMAPIASRPAGAINAVQAKRLELARALSAEPVVVLLDEIFSGLRPDEVDDLAAHVRALPARGQTVMMIEHNLPAIRSVSERVLALSAGAVIREGRPADVFTDPEVVSSYLGKRSSTAP
ncbi:ABC transporter ATP-binding protein [Actinomadura nitritigenes]|uniref:ABC transporter ATP-binding protein n=1 Tax=Actinomadura nitritigenes TaxID=134602 RepID=UPI003D8EA82B